MVGGKGDCWTLWVRAGIKGWWVTGVRIRAGAAGMLSRGIWEILVGGGYPGGDKAGFGYWEGEKEVGFWRYQRASITAGDTLGVGEAGWQ